MRSGSSINCHHLTIGKYKIIDPLAQSEMSVLYRAQDQTTGRHVVIKTVPIPHEGLLQSINREIRALSRLRHPGIVTIIEEGVTDGLPWYAMEFIPGSTLREYCAQLINGKQEYFRKNSIVSLSKELGISSSLPSEPQAGVISCYTSEYHGQVLTLIRRLCAPLAFLHSEGYIHRDLKPDNIMVTSDGSVILVDFGFVTACSGINSREQLLVDQNRVGSPTYMSPEQISNTFVDARVDLYALGCILYELLSGETPFTGSSPYEMLRAHLEKEPIPLSHLVKNLPPGLEKLIQKLLMKEPNDRLGYANDVAAILARCGARNGNGSTRIHYQTYLYHSRLAGRDTQLQTLWSHIEQMRAGNGGLVFISGESGIGKTRLIKEVGAKASSCNIQVLTGQCNPTTSNLLEAFRKLLQTLADRCRASGVKETDYILGERGRILALYEPSLLDLPGQDRYPEPPELPVAAEVRRLFSCLSQTLKILSTREPLLLLLDDLHWGDSLSFRFLSFIAQSKFFEHLPVLILGTFRSEELSGDLQELLETPGMETVHLTPLNKKAITAIVRDMLATSSIPRIFYNNVTRHAEGNPFFVAEYLRITIEEGLLKRRGGGTWQMKLHEQKAATLILNGELPFPVSLQKLISRRLTTLSDRARSVAQVIAILSRDVSFTLLQKMVHYPVEEFWDATDELLRRQVLEKTTEGNLRFIHDKIREVVLHHLSAQVRAMLHRTVAETLEPFFSSEPDESGEEIAAHFEQAGEVEKAQEWYLKSARCLHFQRRMHPATERLFRSYLKLVQVPSRQSIKNHLELCVNLIYQKCHLDDAEQEVRKVLNQIRRGDYNIEEARALQLLADIHHHRGRSLSAIRLFNKALSIAQSEGDLFIEAIIRASIAKVRSHQGKMSEAQVLYEQSLDLLFRLNDKKNIGRVLGSLATLSFYQGRIAEAQEYFEQAIVIHSEDRNDWAVAVNLGNLANVFSHQGRIEQALEFYHKSLKLYRSIGDRKGEATIAINIAGLKTDQGLFTQAIPLLEKALRISRELNDPWTEAGIIGNYATLYLHQGRLKKALQFNERALSLHRRRGNQILANYTLIQQARIRLTLGYVTQARNCLEQALHSAEQIKDPMLKGQCLLFQAHLERRLNFKSTSSSNNLDASDQLFKNIRNAKYSVLTYLEQGHSALAHGQSARCFLEKSETILRQLNYRAHSELERAYQNLKRAHDTFMSQNKELLHQGERVDDLPAGLLYWLRRTGLISSNKSG